MKEISKELKTQLDSFEGEMKKKPLSKQGRDNLMQLHRKICPYDKLKLDKIKLDDIVKKNSQELADAEIKDVKKDEAKRKVHSVGAGGRTFTVTQEMYEQMFRREYDIHSNNN